MGLTQVFYVLLLAALFAALVIFFKAAFTGLRWQARYFEAGSDVAYQTETFFLRRLWKMPWRFILGWVATTF
jgi:hypothetical protein